IGAVLAIEANCLRGTRHMWQMKQPPTTGITSCNRPSLVRPGNATAKTAATSPEIPAGTLGSGGALLSEPTHSAVMLANYVYECASKRITGSCSKQQPEMVPQPELESNQESESMPELPKARTLTLAASEVE
ncbi:hypothetical protein KR009_005160, partial [Drosophila setifemur]